MMKSFLSSRVLYSIRSLFFLVVVLSSFWLISTVWTIRFDATEEKFFTLSDGSKSLVQKLPESVTIKLYFSSSARNVPIPIKAYATRVEGLLKQYVAQSRGQLKLEMLDPRPDTESDTSARRAGLKPVPLGDGVELFFGVAATSGGKDSVIPYLDPRREQYLEYDISEALQKLANKDRIEVGVMSSLSMIATRPAADMESILQGKGDWILVNELRKIANVQNIPTDTQSIPESVKVLVVHHPKGLSELTLRAIDQFVMRGGKLIALVDPFSRHDIEKQFQEGGKVEVLSSDLNTLFSAWGVDFSSSKAVGDQKYPTQINAGGVAVVYPYFVQIADKGFSRSSVISSQLRHMVFPEPGFVGLRAGSDLKFDSLVSTSLSAGAVAVEVLRGGPEGAARRFTAENKAFTIAALFQGKFKTAFPASGKDSKKTLSETKSDSALLVIADADFIADPYAVQKIPFANQIVARPMNDNLNFLVNAVEYLGGSEDLIAIRSRSRFSRPFERLVEIREKAQVRWKSEEDSIQTKLSETQAKLNEMQGARLEGNKLVLSKEQQAEVEKFRSEEAQMRSRLREVRKNLREDIESLGRKLALLNLAVVPVGVSVVGGVVFSRRSRRRRDEKR